MGGRRLAALVAALALLPAALLTGCGGGDDSETTTAGGQRPQDTATGSAKSKEAAERKPAQKQREAGEDSSPSEQAGSAPTPSGSLPNEGTTRVAPDVPTAKGGDNSIQEFGTEGPASNRVQAAGTLQAYLDARVAGEWGRACAYLSASMKKGLVQIAGQAQKQSKDSKPLGCAQIMQALTQGVSKKALRGSADIRVLSMRIDDEQAFLIYKNGEGKPSTIPMIDDGGNWKVGALDGSPLLLSVDSL